MQDAYTLFRERSGMDVLQKECMHDEQETQPSLLIEEDQHDPLRIDPMGFGVGDHDLYPNLTDPFGGTRRGAPLFIGGGRG